MLANAADLNANPGIYPVGTLEAVPVIRQRPEWRRFIVLVWQWQNDVRQDGRLYDLAGLHGFHIDWGATKDDLVRLSRQRRFPYYVDHAAGKGILHLTDDLKWSVIGKESLLVRPYSLADPSTIKTLKSLLRVNVGTTKKGLVYASAFDDEISLGSFNNPAEVDIHPLSLAWYRRWLSHRYGTIQNLNNAWDTSYASFDEVEPVGFEEVRKSTSNFLLSKWNLSRMDGMAPLYGLPVRAGAGRPYTIHEQARSAHSRRFCGRAAAIGLRWIRLCFFVPGGPMDGGL
jgi:hypothetical protein